MGKGDKKTGKGKRFMGSFGNTRKKKNKTSHVNSSTTNKTTKKKTETTKTEPKKASAKKSSPKKSKESNG